MGIDGLRRRWGRRWWRRCHLGARRRSRRRGSRALRCSGRWRWLPDGGLPAPCASRAALADAAVLVGHRRRNDGALAAAVGHRRQALEFFADLPSRLLRRHLAAFDQGAVLGGAAMRLHVAVAIGVDEAQFDGIDAQFMRHHIHVAFDGEIHPRHPEPAHGGRRGAIGEHAKDVGRDVGDGVGAREMPHALDDGVARQPGVGAGVEIAGELARHDAPVVHHPVLDEPAFGAARRPHLHFLHAVP